MDNTPEEPAEHKREIERLIHIPEVRDTLSELGIFVRNFTDGTGFSNYLWKL